MISNYYDEKEDIIFRERKGSINLGELLESIKYFYKVHKNQKELYVIEDSRGSSIAFTVDDYDLIINEILTILGEFVLIKCALIADDPHSAAMSIMFESDILRVSNFKYKTFSTLEAAKEWLKMDGIE